MSRFTLAKFIATNRCLPQKFFWNIFSFDANQYNEKIGHSLLYDITQDRSLSGVKFILKMGGNVNIVSRNYNDSALHITAFKGCEKIAELLIKENADIYLVNGYKETPNSITLRCLY